MPSKPGLEIEDRSHEPGETRCGGYVYGDRMLSIHPDECTSCDAFMPVCPVDAIYPSDTVPDDQRDFIDTNRFVFAETSGP